MSRPIHQRRWARLTSLALLLLVGYGTYRLVRPNPDLKKVRQLQAAFASAQAREWTPEERREKGREMRAAMEQLSPDQRDELFTEGQKRFEDQLKRYAQMTPAEKTKHLDEQIDRSERMRQQFAQRTANGQNPGQRPPGGTGGPGTFGARDPQPGGDGPGGRGQRSSTPEEREKRRKERLDKTTPEFRALRDMYRKDLEARRKQRGLSGAPLPEAGRGSKTVC